MRDGGVSYNYAKACTQKQIKEASPHICFESKSCFRSVRVFLPAKRCASLAARSCKLFPRCWEAVVVSAQTPVVAQ